MKLIPIILSLCFSISAHAQDAPEKDANGKETGGNFEFYYTDVDLAIKQSQKLAVDIINGWPNEVWNHPYFSKPVDHQELVSLIEKARFSRDKEVWRDDPSGNREPLMMNYGHDPQPFIEILLPYFRELKERLHVYDDVNDIRMDTAQALLHEALHIFGYDEAEAQRAARFIEGFDTVVRCDQSASSFSKFSCLTPTGARGAKIKAMITSWQRTQLAQPYSLIYSGSPGVAVSFDLFKKFNFKNSFKTLQGSGVFKSEECREIESILICNSEKETIFFDFLGTFSIAKFDIPYETDWDNFYRMVSHRNGGFRTYVANLFRKAPKPLLWIKRND